MFLPNAISRYARIDELISFWLEMGLCGELFGSLEIRPWLFRVLDHVSHNFNGTTKQVTTLITIEDFTFLKHGPRLFFHITHGRQLRKPHERLSKWSCKRSELDIRAAQCATRFMLEGFLQ